MLGALKWFFGLGLVAALGIGAGIYFAFNGGSDNTSAIKLRRGKAMSTVFWTAAQEVVESPERDVCPPETPSLSPRPLRN